MLSTPYNLPLNITLSATDGTTPYTFSTTTAPAHGTLSGTAPTFTYIPGAGYAGNDSFTYLVTDANGFSAVGMVNITVLPRLVTATPDLITKVNVPVSVVLSATGGTPPYVFAATSSPLYGTLSGTAPALLYTPNAGYFGADSFTYKVTDARGVISNGFVSLTVDAPVADVSVTATAQPNPVHLGAALTYSFVVENDGPEAAPDVTFSDTLSSNETFVSASTSSTAVCTHVAGVVTCPLGALAADQSVTVTVATTVNLVDVQTLSNSVSIATTGSDPDMSDNARILTTSVTLPGTPAQVLLGAPANGATLATTRPNLSWQSAVNAEHYELQIASDSAFTTIVASDAQLEGVTSFDAVLDLGTYYWRVRGWNSLDVAGSWSVARSLTIPASAAQVNLVTTLVNPPATAAFGASLTYRVDVINHGPNTAASVVLLITLPDLTSFVSGSGAVCAVTVYPDVPCELGQLLPNQTTTITINALANRPSFTSMTFAAHASTTGTETNSANNTASAALGYTLPPTPPQVALVAPDNAAITTDSTPTFTWNTASSAARYEVQLASSASFSTLAAAYTAVGTAHTPTAALVDGDYFWRARGVNAAEVAGAWSAARSFTVNAVGPSGTAVLTAPANGAVLTTAQPAFTWTAAEGASRYRLQVDDTADFSSPTLDIIVTGVTHSNASLAQSSYHWRILPLNAALEAGLWSAASQFSNHIRRAPAENSFTTDRTPTFQWFAVTGHSYWLEADNDPTFASLNYTCGWTATTSCTPTTSLPVGRYYWRVRVTALDGSFPPVGTFTITGTPPAAPSLSAPANNAVTRSNTPTLSWNRVTSAAGYDVQVDNNSTFASPEYTGASGSTSVTLPALIDGRYYWRVRSLNTLGAPGAWSSARNFTIDTVGPAAPALTTPANNAATTDRTPAFTWGASTSATRYQVRITGAVSFESGLLSVRSYTVPSSRTLPLGIYTWQVKAVDAAGNHGAWSSPRTLLVTNMRAPANNATLTDRTPTFTWNAVSGGRYQLQVTTAADYLDNQQFDTPVYTCPLAGTTTQTSCTPAQALPAGVYYWRLSINNVFNGIVFPVTLS